MSKIQKFAEFTQLLLMLVCAIIAEYGPIAGKYAGRYAARAVYYSRQIAAKIVEVYQSEMVQSMLSAVEYETRLFVSEQFGDMLPQISVKIAPAKVVFSAIDFLTTFETMTRRELLAYAKTAAVPNYSRLTTDELRQAVASI